MIISTTTIPTFDDFAAFMEATSAALNSDADSRPEFYQTKGGRELEGVVKDVMVQCAKGTKFEDSIELVGGQKFPDILARKYYGVEVKSSAQDHWITIGNSVLESTRIKDVEHIFLLFGKLSGKIAFKARRYQDCLAEVVVTHYPRYKIDMNIPSYNTIFDKMNIDYDVLRKLHNPIEPIVSYYKSTLRDGESLWWIDNVESEQLPQLPMTVRLWRVLSSEEKDFFITKALVYFPEIFGSDSRKYDAFTLWLVTQYGVVSTSARDAFSAGGKVRIMGNLVPQIYGKILLYKQYIVQELERATMQTSEAPLIIKGKNFDEKLQNWIESVVGHSKMNRDVIKPILQKIFLE